MPKSIKNPPVLHCGCASHMFGLAGMDPDRELVGQLEQPQPGFVDRSFAVASEHAQVSDECTHDLYKVIPSDRTLVLKNATVLPMDGTPQRIRNIEIRDGIIIALKSLEETLPANAYIIDCTGKFILPGLADIHTHPHFLNRLRIFAPLYNNSNPEDFLLPYDLLMFVYLAAGVTRIQIMDGSAEELAVRKAMQSGKFYGPEMRIASPIIDASSNAGLQAPWWFVNDGRGAREAAALVKQRGYDFAKPYSRLSAASVEALMSECDDLGIETMGHVSMLVGVEGAISFGQKGVAHMAELFLGEPVDKRADPVLRSARAQLIVENDIWVQTTLVATKSMDWVLGNTEHNFPMLDLMHPLTHALYAENGSLRSHVLGNPMLVDLLTGLHEIDLEYARELAKAGAKLLPGTDAPLANLVDGFSLHEEFRILVEQVGMRPLEVLTAATATAAHYQGVSEQVGTITPGKRSDLVVVREDPTVSIRSISSIDTTVIGNVVLDKNSIEIGLQRVRDRYASMPL